MKVFLLVKLVFKRQEKSGKTLKNFLKQLLFFCSVVIWTKKTFFVLFCPSAITVKKKQSKAKQLCEITCFCFHVLKSPIFSLKKKKQPTLLVCKTFVLVNDGKKPPSFCLNQFFCGFFFTKSVSFGVWLLMQLFLPGQRCCIKCKVVWKLLQVLFFLLFTFLLLNNSNFFQIEEQISSLLTFFVLRE